MMESGATLIGAGYARSVMVKENGLLQPDPGIDLLMSAAAHWEGMVSCYADLSEEDSASKSKSDDKEDSVSKSIAKGEDKGKKSSKGKGKGKN